MIFHNTVIITIKRYISIQSMVAIAIQATGQQTPIIESVGCVMSFQEFFLQINDTAP
jgi:hypothetical protein